MRIVQLGYLLVCALAGGSLFLLPLSLLISLPLSLLFVLLAWRTWTQRCELGGEPVQLVWDTAQRWWWYEGGTEMQVSLCGDSFLSNRVCVLNFHCEQDGRYRSLVLLPSVSGKECYRRLLVRFRITADPLAQP